VRIAALIAMPVSVAGSVALMLTGRANPSLVLALVMTIWVAAPLVALETARRLSKRWPILRPAALHVLIVVIAAVSLVIYAVDAAKALHPKAAFVYVVVPLCAWILIAAVLAAGALLHRRDRDAV
jgi:hypothetical protein